MQQPKLPSPLAKLLYHLQADFENEPVEDGMEHQAEHTLTEALEEQAPQELLPWLTELCTNMSSPAMASSVLRCLSSLPLPGTPEWRAYTVRQALASSDIEIRDAAMQAVEHWGEPALAEVLRTHEEPEKWLRQYRDGIIGDLAPEASADKKDINVTISVTTRPKGVIISVDAPKPWRKHPTPRGLWGEAAP